MFLAGISIHQTVPSLLSLTDYNGLGSGQGSPLLQDEHTMSQKGTESCLGA